ncbi:Uncharacterised protein [Neisseria lactamica]|uniref:Uncharacterized protein n=1 Tax=Neisseria lactamica TaxID=486 RepID=A0A378VLE9_NEILA|nr:Uncharacterised protein [Neisseria lactamica]
MKFLIQNLYRLDPDKKIYNEELDMNSYLLISLQQLLLYVLFHHILIKNL